MKYKALVILLFLSFDVPYLQDQKIKLQQNELNEIKTEIRELEKELSQKSIKERETFSVLENFSKQNFLLNKLIGRIRTEEKIKQNKIAETERNISALEKEIKSLKENYANYVVSVYKTGKVNELASIIDVKSVEQALVRYKYLKKFSEKRNEDLEALKENINKLASAKTQLENERKEKAALAAQKQKEEKELVLKLNDRKKILNSIKNDKTALEKELDAKRNAEVKIKSLIAKLIEEERKREEEKLAADKLNNPATENKIANETSAGDYNLNLTTAGFASFAALKGKLNWPVNSGKIIRKFGENKNQQLNTITLNYGVDIQTSADVNVRSVAEGVVSVIDWIPGYGSIIILTHKDNYRTVYSHLSEIFVKEGDKVNGGSLLAKVGESLEGHILHFEIWNSRNNQNPEIWLAKK